MSEFIIEGTDFVEQNDSPIGVHYLVECREVVPELLVDLELLKSTLTKVAVDAGAKVVDTLLHQFNPHGLSGVVVIAESHIAIHTWPEHNYAAIDIFTCGDVIIAENIYAEILKIFKPAAHNIKKIERKVPSLKMSEH